MADLLLDEQRVETVLDQMRDIRVPQAVRVQHRVESEVVAPVGESVVDVIETDAALPFGRPQDRLVSEVEARPNLGDVCGTIVSGLVIPAVLILALLAVRRRWAATFVFLTCVLRGAVVAVVKELVGRPRPEGRLVATNSESFPSGHSASAAIIVLMLVLIFSSQQWLPYLGGLYVLAMMWSRTYLHVHWLTDTIAGALLGVAAALAVWIVLRERIARESRSGTVGAGNSSSEKTENY